MLFSSKNNNGLHLVLLAALLFAVSGCSNNMGELEEYVASVKANPPGDIPPIPEIKTYDAYIYPGHEFDPFDAAALETVIFQVPERTAGTPGANKNKKGPILTINENRSREYLEGFPLDSLSMVGTLSQKGQLWALIQTSDGTIQRVSKGNYLGKNHGKINTISETEITLEEMIPDRFKGYVKRPAAIAIKEMTQ